MRRKPKAKMSIWRYLTLGYLLVVLLGSALLVLPFATKGGSTSYIDALFTSASAACVTGLVPFDTGAHWTLFGQIVILLLIQLGGLGFTTFVSILLILTKRGFGLYERSAVMQSLGGGRLAGVKTLVKRIIIGTFAIEFLGAVLLCIRFIPDFGAAKGIYFSIFHAISAFCNAGFDVIGSSSFATYATDPLVSLTLCALIVIGGLGFCVWGDILDCKGNPKKFQFYTRFILTASAILLVLSTALFLLFERSNPAYADYNFGEKLLCALFNATTARTAGFYTTHPALLSESGYLLMLVLMFIGGCSGSTAGGIKVGTFAVMIMGMVSAFRGKRDISLGKRRVDRAQLGQALAVFTSYLSLVLLATMAICTVESQLGFQMVLFETVSALGTVGLTMGLTPLLGVFSKLIIIVLMYAGRVGVLTIAFALGRKRQETSAVRRPAETIFIG